MTAVEMILPPAVASSRAGQRRGPEDGGVGFGAALARAEQVTDATAATADGRRSEASGRSEESSPEESRGPETSAAEDFRHDPVSAGVITSAGWAVDGGGTEHGVADAADGTPVSEGQQTTTGMTHPSSVVADSALPAPLAASGSAGAVMAGAAAAVAPTSVEPEAAGPDRSIGRTSALLASSPLADPSSGPVVTGQPSTGTGTTSASAAPPSAASASARPIQGRGMSATPAPEVRAPSAPGSSPRMPEASSPAGSAARTAVAVPGEAVAGDRPTNGASAPTEVDSTTAHVPAGSPTGPAAQPALASTGTPAPVGGLPPLVAGHLFHGLPAADVTTATPEAVEAARATAASAPAAPAPAAPAPAGPAFATPTAAAAAPASDIASPRAFAAQVSPVVVSVAQRPAGEHRITVTVHPDELGPVTVRAHITARGDVQVELLGGTDAGRDALRSIVSDLRRDLAAVMPQATLSLGSATGQDAADRGAQSGAGGGPGEQQSPRRESGPDPRHPRASERMAARAIPTPLTLAGGAGLDTFA